MIVEVTKSTKVRSCPLCGDEAFLHSDSTSRHTLFWVKCVNLQCGCTVKASDDQEKILAGWNRRA
jgi:Lar family restriction alleviation protein